MNANNLEERQNMERDVSSIKEAGKKFRSKIGLGITKPADESIEVDTAMNNLG